MPNHIRLCFRRHSRTGVVDLSGIESAASILKNPISKKKSKKEWKIFRNKSKNEHYEKRTLCVNWNEEVDKLVMYETVPTS
jgi:hypothetical protein